VSDGDIGVLTGRNHFERLITIHRYTGIGRDARDQRRIPADRSVRKQVERLDDVGLFTVDDLVGQNTDLGRGTIRHQQRRDAIGIGTYKASEDCVRFNLGSAENVKGVADGGNTLVSLHVTLIGPSLEVAGPLT
jgi:hypothetical protein